MKSKSSIIFFGLALFVILSWLIIEFILYSDESSQNQKSCRFTSEHKNRFLDEKKLLGISDQLLWTFDSKSEKILRFRMSSEVGFLEKPIDQGIQLRCQTPDYQCFTQVRDGGFELLNPFLFQNNVFLIEGSQRDQKKIYPVAWRDQQIRLATPLKICNRSPKAEPSLYSVNSDRILYFDEDQSLLGIWLIQGFEGASSKAASKEPDQIFTVKEGVGFELSNCEEAEKRGKVKSLVQFMENETILINDGSRNVETRSYSIENGMTSPQEPSKLIKKGVSALKGTLSLAQFIKFNEESLLLTQSRFFLAPLNFSLVKEEDLYSFPRFSWEVRRSNRPVFLSTQVNKEVGWLFLQESKGISARQFSCSR